MLRIVLAFLCLALPLQLQAASDNMLYVEFRLTGKQIAADSFDAQPKKLWRIAKEYLRFEDAPNAQTKIHGMIIVAEPDIWFVDRTSNQAQHTVDPGPDYKVHFPIFASEDSMKLRELEFGSELDFFRQSGAKELPAQDVDGFKCKRLLLELDDREVVLFTKTDDTPLQISVKSPTYEYEMRFLRYENNRKVDKSLFQLPPDVKTKKAG